MAQGRSFIQAGRQAGIQGACHGPGPDGTAGQGRKAVAAWPGRVAQSALSPENTRQQLGIREASKGYGPAAGSEHTAHNETTSGYVPAAGPVLEFARTEPLRLCMSVLPRSSAAQQPGPGASWGCRSSGAEHDRTFV